MCKFCATSDTWPFSQHRNKNDFKWSHFTFIDFFSSHEMESKWRTQSPSRQCCCLNIPVCAKIEEKKVLGKTEIKKTASLHRNINTQFALQVFAAWSFSSLKRSVARDLLTFQHRPWVLKSHKVYVTKLHAYLKCTDPDRAWRFSLQEYTFFYI